VPGGKKETKREALVLEHLREDVWRSAMGKWAMIVLEE
jgi:hypothetical protein